MTAAGLRFSAAAGATLLCTVAAAAVAATTPGIPRPPAAGSILEPVQFTYPWEEGEKKERKAKRAKSAKPADTPAPTPPSGSDTSTVEEIAHKGQRIRVLHDAAAATLRIELNDKAIGRIEDVGQVKKPFLLPGTYQSLVAMWTKNAAQSCSSYVLVLLPMTESSGKAEVKSGFGACNASTRQLTTRRGTWETWAIIAFREDSAKASVAVARNDKLAISQQAARPCLFSKEPQEQSRCTEEYIAAGLGSAERGAQSGEQRVAGHRLETFLNRSASTGSIELNGRTFKAFTNVKALHVESSALLDRSALYTIWMQPADEGCGYRMLLRLDADGKERQVLDRVGPCRQKSANQVRRRRDDTVSGWATVMWRDGDRQVDVASWSGGEIVLRSMEADACIAAPTLTSECFNRLLPADLAKDAPAAVRPGASAASPAMAPSQVPLTQNPMLLKGFRLLAQHQTDLAIAEFDRVLIAEPANAWAFTGRGYGLALKGKLDNALADLDRAVQINPRLAHAFTYRGFVFLLRREPDRALAQLDQALLLNARLPEAYAIRGGAYLAKGDTSRALTDLNKSIEILPKNVLAFGTRAQVHATLKEHQKAIDDFSAAIELLPGSLANFIGRARSREALGQTSEALADYQAAVALRPASINDIVLQTLARQRVNALGGGRPGGNPPGGCAKGQTCL